MTSVPRGNFSTLKIGDWDREMIESAFQAVDSVEGGWDFLKTYEPGEGGFMFSKPPPKMEEIDKAVMERYGGHSGASYGGTMRVIEFIAKNGWDAYVKQVGLKRVQKKETMEEKRKRFLALPTNMTLQEQKKAIDEFMDVPMTYAEMRERFG